MDDPLSGAAAPATHGAPATPPAAAAAPVIPTPAAPAAHAATAAVAAPGKTLLPGMGCMESSAISGRRCVCCDDVLSPNYKLAKWIAFQCTEYKRLKKGKDSILTLEQFGKLNAYTF